MSLFDVPEFTAFIRLYAFYEVVGMKMEMTVQPNAPITGCGIYGGMIPDLSNYPPVPTNE